MRRILIVFFSIGILTVGIFIALNIINEEKSVFDLIRKNKIDKLRELNPEDLNINSTNDTGLTPLHLAAKKGLRSAAEYLIKGGADINKKAKSTDEMPATIGLPPLHYAVQAGNKKVVQLLIKEGADVNQKPNGGYYNSLSSLHLAVVYKRPKIVRMLLENGAEVDARYGRAGEDAPAYTPLDYAQQLGYEKIIKILKKYGSEDEAIYDSYPLHAAVIRDDVNSVKKLIINQYVLNEQPDTGPLEGLSPLHLTAQDNNIEMIDVLVKKGADVNSRREYGATPLYLASKWGWMSASKRLLEYGADVNAQTKTGYAPMHAVAYEGHLDVVKLLVRNGADVNIKTIDDVTPIRSAVNGGHLNIVKYLHQNGANIDVRTSDAWTLLHLAAYKGHVKITKYLLDKGLKPEAKTVNGDTPKSIAEAYEHHEILDLLEQYY